jgi:Na+/melibiose symporter-like transporter
LALQFSFNKYSFKQILRQLLQSGTEKLPVKEKIGYELGDSAANFVFQTMIMRIFNKLHREDFR